MAYRTFQSWKEIAQYVGRGVRTVQRWEALHGFPVHRPAGRTRTAVFAIEHEIDVWLSSCDCAVLDDRRDAQEPPVERLRERLEMLEAECVRLRRALQTIAASQNGDLRPEAQNRQRVA